MGTKNNNALFYTCSLIEYIGRVKKKIQTGCDGIFREKGNTKNL